MNKDLLLSGAAALGVLALIVPAQANDELISLQEDDTQWVMPLGDYASTRYSTLEEINKDNVGDLQVAWTFSTGVLRGHEGGPLVIGDIMYVHTPFPNIVYALDLNDDARVIWKYEPKQDPDVIPVMCCDTVNRGPAYADGTLSISTRPTPRLVALDAKTGEVKWSVQNGDAKKGETGTSAPMVIGDKVLVGISGGEFGVQGHVTAYNTADGSIAWRGYSTGPDDQTLDGSRSRPLISVSLSVSTAVRRPGKAISGRSAAAPPGAGSPTILILILFIMARATRRPGTQSSGLAIIAGR